MCKRILALLLAMVLLVSCGPCIVLAEPAHVHCACGKQTQLNATCDDCGQKAVEWTAAQALPAQEGHYYLTKDISTETAEYKNNAQVAICLHGHTVTSAAGGQLLAAGGGAVVTLTDCAKEQGSFTGCTSYAYGSAMRVKKGGTLKLYGGKITGNTGPSGCDGTIYVDKGDATTAGGAFYMYGGEISGNTARRGAGIGTASATGTAQPGTIYILGGKITGNTGTGTGGTKGGAGILAFGLVEIGGNAVISGNNAAEGPDDVYLRNKGFAGALTVSKEVPLTGNACVNFGSDTEATDDPKNLTCISGTPESWSCGWVSYGGQSVSYVEGKFVLGHFHGTQEYSPISDNVAMKNAGGYGYLTKDLKLGGEQTRSKDLHLCLNGHTIQAAANKRIFGSSSATPMEFHIEDCTAYRDEEGVYHAGKLTGGNNASGTGGAMAIVAGSKLYLHDGIITGNNAGAGGALLLTGEFCMLGGQITDNTAKTDATWKNGGAIQINKGGKAVISGGEISGNEAAKGSAIYTANACTLEISGGSITGNIAHEAGAVYAGNGAVLTLSGAPVIQNNKLGQAKSNIYLAEDTLLTVGQLETGAALGLGAQVNDRAVSHACQDVHEYFTGDDEQFPVTYQNGALFLGMPIVISHVHGICGSASCQEHESVGFADWTEANALPTSGSYCLTTDVTLTEVVTVSDSLKLCLNGHTITQTGAKRIFEIEGSGRLTVTDCTSAGQIMGGVNDTGAAIFIKEGATFNLYGGKLTGSKPATENKATAGAAIFLRSSQAAGATFNMYGGEITGNGNSMSWGGAVSNGSGSPEHAVYVNIYGGKIHGNTAGTGAAIRLENQGVLTISGGEITNNTATNSGGAVYLSKGAQLQLLGGRISGNSALLGGGIFTTTTAGNIRITGAPVVKDNTVSGKQNNLYLNGQLTITVGELTQNAQVGITAAVGSRAISAETATDLSSHFPSDSAYKLVTWKNGALYITDATDHQHCVCDGAAAGCDHAAQVWTAWESTTTLPTVSGHYYLTEDVQLTALVKLEGDQNIALCLNGKTVTAAENTGHMILTKGTTLSITDCAATAGGFTGGNKAYGGSVNVVAGSVMNLYAGEFHGNNAPASEGGAVYLQGGNGSAPGGIFNMYGGKIHGNTAGIGGGIRAAGLGTDGQIPSQLNIYGGEISGNKSFYKLGEDGKPTDIQGEGGAIAATNGTTVNIHGGIISGNVAEDDGGAIYINNKAQLTVKGGKLQGNEAKRYGGAVFATAEGTSIVLNGGELAQNKASTAGAVMLQSRAVLTMNGGKLQGNTTPGSGAGIYVSTNTDFLMNGGEITGNTATGSGAGFYALRSRVTLAGGQITDNRADYRGGAFVSSGATVVLNKTLIKNNSAKEGGAAYINRSKSTNAEGKINYTPSNVTLNDGAVLTGNKADVNTGGLLIGNDGVVVTMNGGEISGSTAMNGAALMTMKGSTFIMKGGKITGNTASVYGGGLYISTETTFKMEGGTISGNTARNGGGIYMLRSTGLFTGGSVSGNYVKQKKTVKADGTEVLSGGMAGAMYMSGADCELRGTAFTGNTSEGNGGALVLGRASYTKDGVKLYDNVSLNIYAGQISDNHSGKVAGGMLIQSKETVVNMYGGTFSDNSAESSAGAIYVSTDTTFNMEGGSIVNNSTKTSAGGMYILRANVNITGGQIHGNTAVSSGAQLVASGDTAQVVLKNLKFHGGSAKIAGALVSQSYAHILAENCEFYDNATQTNAGAVYISTRSYGEFVNCKFYNNRSKGAGGAVTAANFSYLTIRDSQFTDNASDSMGGAVYANPASETTIENCTFRNCTAETRGGAITCRGTMFLTNSLIENCSAKTDGGAIYTDANTAGGSGVQRGLVVKGTEVRNNSAGGMGGAFYVFKGCRLELYDSTITDNTALAEGGAIWAYEDLELHNTQITGNTSGGEGYAVYMHDANFDGHSYFTSRNKLSGSTVIRDNPGGDLWMGKDVVFAVAAEGMGADTYIRLTLDSGVVTNRILGAYNYEGGDQNYTITYGDRSLTDPEIVLQENETTDPTRETTEPAGEEKTNQNALLYVGIGSIVVVIAAAAAIVVLLEKKKAAKKS